MGFFSALKGLIFTEVVPDTTALVPPPPPPPPFFMPDIDEKGNGIANMIIVDITGVTHKHNCDPQIIIPAIKMGTALQLVPDKRNEFDDTAIKVLTLEGEQIGWYPSKGPIVDMLYRRLIEKRTVHCYLFDRGQSKNGIYWCKIKIAYYATEYEKSLEDKNKERQEAEEKQKSEKREKLLQDFRSVYKNKISNLCGVEKEYWDCFYEVLKNERFIEYLNPEEQGTAFAIRLGATEIAVIKQVRNITYCLMASNFNMLASAKSNPDVDVRPATKSEGTDKVRLVISSPSDVLQYKDFILFSYSASLPSEERYLKF